MLAMQDSFVYIHIARDSLKNFQCMSQIGLRAFESGDHITAQRQKRFSLPSLPYTFPNDGLISGFHRLVLVTIQGHFAAGKQLEHLLSKSTLIAVWERRFAEYNGVRHVGVEGAQDNGQGADTKGGNLFGKDFCKA